MTLTYSIL